MRTAPEPARVSAPRRVRGRAAQDAGRQGQSQGAARAGAAGEKVTCRLSTIERSFPKITEEGLDELRRRIGVKIGETAEPWCHEATRDNIRHYAHGIGDDNPLWCEPEYAAKTTLRRHHRAAELPVRHQPHHLGLCRRPAGRARDVVGRRLELAQDGQPQRRDHDRGLAQGPDRRTRRASPAARSSRSITSTSSTRTATWWPTPTAGASAPSATTRARRAPSTRRCARSAAAPLHRRGAGGRLQAVRRGEDPRRRDALLGGRQGRRGAADDGQGPDDGDRLHRLRAGLGRPVHPRQQARLEAHRRASGPRHQEPLRHSRLSRARALGRGVRARGRRARRVRLRPGALLLAHAPPDQLDGRRRLPAQRDLQDPPPQSRKATCCSSRAR